MARLVARLDPVSALLEPPHRKRIQQQLFNGYSSTLYTHMLLKNTLKLRMPPKSTKRPTSAFEENPNRLSIKRPTRFWKNFGSTWCKSGNNSEHLCFHSKRAGKWSANHIVKFRSKTKGTEEHLSQGRKQRVARSPTNCISPPLGVHKHSKLWTIADRCKQNSNKFGKIIGKS